MIYSILWGILAVYVFFLVSVFILNATIAMMRFAEVMKQVENFIIINKDSPEAFNRLGKRHGRMD